MNVVIDFFEDVRKDFVAALSRLGIALEETAAVDVVSTEFFHQIRRRIPARPRKVVWSRELRDRSLTPQERSEVEGVAKELADGIDTFRRLTRSINKSVRRTIETKKGREYDGLLTDWNIHHLHIGTEVDPKTGMIVGQDLLLFVFVTPAAAYLLDVRKHSESPWADQSLFNILHDNWPEAIAHLRAAGFVGEPPPPSQSPEEEKSLRDLRQKARRMFTMGTVAPDGTLYIPAGGVLASGHLTAAGRQSDRLLNLVHPAELWVREHAEWVRGQIENAAGEKLEELYMRFETNIALKHGVGAVFESTTGIGFIGVPPREGQLPRMFKTIPTESRGEGA